MSILRSFTVGFRRVAKFPSVILWLYLASVTVTLPLTMAMREILMESIGASLVDENLRQGFDLAWYGEFSANSRGLAKTFGPSVVGIMAMVGNLETLLDGDILKIDGTILLAGLVFLLVWAFLGGGILDRYARPDQAHSSARFFSEGGKYFFRFVRLLSISLLLYWLLFRWILNPLHRCVEEATRDVTVEKTVLFYTLLVYTLAGFLLLLVKMALDYAKIAMVVELRRSSVAAFLQG